jgi:hypothetical protein
MTKEQFLAKRKLEWLKQERRDFIDVFLEEWECDQWMAEWEEQEQAFHDQWHEQHPDGHCQLVRALSCVAKLRDEHTGHCHDIQESSVPYRDHQPRSVAVLSVLLELSRCRRAAI